MNKKAQIGKWAPANVIFNCFNYIVLTVLTLLCLYPILHVIFASKQSHRTNRSPGTSF